MRFIPLLLLFSCASAQQEAPGEYGLYPFNAVIHCFNHHECRVQQYGEPSEAESRLCYAGMVGSYQKKEFKDQVVMDAFYTDCQALQACEYVNCIESHRGAHHGLERS